MCDFNFKNNRNNDNIFDNRSCVNFAAWRGCYRAFKWIKQPVVLGYIVAGFLASPHFEYLPSVTTEENIEFWAQIGIIVLLFSLGLEFSFKNYSTPAVRLL